MRISPTETNPEIIQRALIDQGYVDTSDGRALTIAYRHEERMAAAAAAAGRGGKDAETKTNAGDLDALQLEQRRRAAITLGESAVHKPRITYTVDGEGNVVRVHPARSSARHLTSSYPNHET